MRRPRRTLSAHRERVAAAYCFPCVPFLSPRDHTTPHRHLLSPRPTASAVAATAVPTQSGVVRSLSLWCTADVPDRRCSTGRGVWNASGSRRCLSGSSSSSSSAEGKSSAENAREAEDVGATSTALSSGEGNGKRVVVGMSGGVDSSVVAMLLQQQVSEASREHEPWELLGAVVWFVALWFSYYWLHMILGTTGAGFAQVWAKSAVCM